jgi:hypothetical protein
VLLFFPQQEKWRSRQNSSIFLIASVNFKNKAAMINNHKGPFNVFLDVQRVLFLFTCPTIAGFGRKFIHKAR